MYKLAIAAAAAAVLALPAVTPTPAQAGWHGHVRYVPAVYCTYKSKDWVQKGIVSCPDPFWPIGFPGTKWKTNSGALMCWNTNTGFGKDYAGWWSPCPK